MQRVLALLRAEPAALGTVVASVLPALVALGVFGMKDQTIGVLVVAINAVVGFLVRLSVTPRPGGSGPDVAPARTPAPAQQ
jgi:hypothetical protein